MRVKKDCNDCPLQSTPMDLIHIMFIDRLSLSVDGLRITFRDYLVICRRGEEKEDRDCLRETDIPYTTLRMPHFSLRESPDYWENRSVKEFFEKYREEMRNLLAQLPSIRYGGTYILTNIRRKDMPFEKEVRQAGILQTSLLSLIPDVRVVILPRYINSLIEEEFNIHLRKGSLADAILIYDDRIEYLEFKTSTERHLSREVKNGLSLSDDCFVVIDDFGPDDDKKEGWKNLRHRLKSDDEGKRIFLAEIKGTGLIKIERGDISYYVTPEPLKDEVEPLVMDSNREMIIRQEIKELRNYMVSVNPEKANMLLNYEEYLQAITEEIGDK